MTFEELIRGRDQAFVEYCTQARDAARETRGESFRLACLLAFDTKRKAVFEREAKCRREERMAARRKANDGAFYEVCPMAEK